MTVSGDIGKRDIARSLIETAVERFGRVDTLVNNAGIFIGKPFTEYTVEDFQAILNVNIQGFFHVTQAAIAQMLKRPALSLCSRIKSALGQRSDGLIHGGPSLG